MAGLHKAISQVVHKTEIADIDLDHAADFDLEEMGLKVVQRYIDESVHETELVAEIRKNLQTIMDLDFCLSDTKLLTEIVSHYHRGSPNSALIFVPLLAKLEPEVGKKLLNELLKSQFDFVYQSLQEFFKLTLEWDVTKFQHKELVLEVYEMLFSSLFVGLAAKKAENLDKRVEMLLRCLSIFATLCSKI